MNDKIMGEKDFMFFARYHVSDITAVMGAIKEKNLGTHFLIENPGRNEAGELVPNSFTLYTDLIRRDASEAIKAYRNLMVRSHLGLIISHHV